MCKRLFCLRVKASEHDESLQGMIIRRVSIKLLRECTIAASETGQSQSRIPYVRAVNMQIARCGKSMQLGPERVK